MQQDLTKLKVITTKTHEAELRTPSKPVDLDEINTPEFQNFVDNLHEAMLAVELKPGWMAAGISAVQVGVHKTLFWAYNGNYDAYELFINPEVELLGDATDVKTESCLSILDVEAPVERHKRVRVTYYDRDGVKLEKEFTGWNARVIQHEYDHLQGILFTDKLVEKAEAETEESALQSA